MNGFAKTRCSMDCIARNKYRRADRLSVISMRICWVIGIMTAFICNVRAQEPIHLPLGANYFIDDYLIEESVNLTRTTHQPERLPDPILGQEESWHEQPLYGLEVHYNQSKKLFEMWYNVKNPTSRNPFTGFAYAQSPDGIQWERKPLGLVEVDGSTENNLFKANEYTNFSMVLFDDGPQTEIPEHRYNLDPSRNY